VPGYLNSPYVIEPVCHGKILKFAYASDFFSAGWTIAGKCSVSPDGNNIPFDKAL
jgi:hypothetical protein